MLKSPSLLPIFLGTTCYLSIPVKSAIAQVTSDNTVNTQVTQNGNIAEITGGETRGGNLFHSFQDFSVPTNNEAFFNNANAIDNIFSRVTGGNISNIDGLIRANGNANLFLINPAGIMFGEGARLDLGGSFYGSTATSILFEDGEFSAADLDNPPLLTVNAPIGLGFRDNPGDINVQSSNLRVATGRNLSLLGKDINLNDAYLEAIDGRVTLGATSAANTVTFNENLETDFSNSSLADIQLNDASQINVTGTGGGEIRVTSRNLTLRESSIFNGGISSSSTELDSQAGNITINVLESVALESGSLVRNNVNLNGFGNAGEIQVSAQNLTLTDNSRLSSISQGNGNSGNIKIAVGDNIFLDSSNIQTSIIRNGTGSAGNIEINASNLTLTGESKDIRANLLADSSGNGEAGNITIKADLLSVAGGSNIGTLTENDTDGGEIKIEAQSIELNTGGTIATSTANIGNAGNIILDVKDSIVINGNNPLIPAEDLRFTVRTLQELESFTGLFANTTTTSMGNGGNIQISNPQTISISNSGEIAVNSLGSGNGGNLIIESGSLALDNQSKLIAETVFGQAEQQPSNITLQIDELLSLKGDSVISASALNNANGGNVTISSDFIVAFPPQIKDNGGNDIIANAREGFGGNISIETKGIFGMEVRTQSSQTNDIDASSQVNGLDGTVSITTPDVNPINSLPELPNSVIESQHSVIQACQNNRFT